MEAIGLISEDDEGTPDLSDSVIFAVWSKFIFKSKVATNKITELVVANDEIEGEITQEIIREAYNCDESQIIDAEVIEKVEKRFSKSLPLDSINIILLLEQQLQVPQ